MITAPRSAESPTAATNGREHAIHGIFEPPDSFAYGAIVRHRWIVGLCALLLALAGGAYGLSRPATYTASATLQVGQVNPNSPGFFGYVQSAASLATAFSRAIDAEPVLAAVQDKLRVPPRDAAGRLSSSPIPTSPAFRVIATGPSELAAVQLANTASAALIAYEGHSNSTNPQAESLLHEYRDASIALRRTVAEVARASRHKRGYSPALAAAEAQKNAASVKLRAIGVAYTSAISTRGPSSGLVSLLAGAQSASSDHSAKVQKFALIGLLVGVVIGCLVALALARRTVRREPTG